MHAQDRDKFKKYIKCEAYEEVLKLKEEGKIKHFGISFHDSAEVLDEILSKYPQIEIVQIQFNYIDYGDHSVQSKECYEVCVKHNKPCIIMEPVKGGSLVNIPLEGREIFSKLGGSPASYAIRFAASFDNNVMVLSGMSSLEMIEENCAFMKDFKPLNEEERAAVNKVREIILGKDLIPCTGCSYCLEVCPKHIAIPQLFSIYNSHKVFNSWNSSYYYHNVHTSQGRRAKDCIGCKKCMSICPQHLEIPSLLKEASKVFDHEDFHEED